MSNNPNCFGPFSSICLHFIMVRTFGLIKNFNLVVDIRKLKLDSPYVVNFLSALSCNDELAETSFYLILFRWPLGLLILWAVYGLSLCISCAKEGTVKFSCTLIDGTVKLSWVWLVSYYIIGKTNEDFKQFMFSCLVTN